MSIMKEEILSQERVLKKCIDKNINKVKNIADVIKKSGKYLIEIVARGSSRNACIAFKYHLESNSKYRVTFVYPSTYTKYNGIVNEESIFIAVSQGGKGEDVRIIMDKARKSNALTIGITNDNTSPLYNTCEYNLILNVDKENAMAATKSYTSEVLLLNMLSNELLGIDNNYLYQVPSLINNIDYDKLDKFADKIVPNKNLFVLSRGPLLGVTSEICCKFQETCFINANSFAVSDFMHGPYSLVDDWFNSIVIVPVDETKDDVIELIKKANSNFGHIFAIANCDVECDYLYKVKTLDKSLYQYEVIMTIQMLASILTEKLHTNPDTSRNLSKYTKTI